MLGVSGAGKTSTLNMILGQEDITGGKATLTGYDVAQDFYRKPDKMHTYVGYCPQENSISENLTVK